MFKQYLQFKNNNLTKNSIIGKLLIIGFFTIFLNLNILFADSLYLKDKNFDNKAKLLEENINRSLFININSKIYCGLIYAVSLTNQKCIIVKTSDTLKKIESQAFKSKPIIEIDLGLDQTRYSSVKNNDQANINQNNLYARLYNSLSSTFSSVVGQKGDTGEKGDAGETGQNGNNSYIPGAQYNGFTSITNNPGPILSIDPTGNANLTSLNVASTTNLNGLNTLSTTTFTAGISGAGLTNCNGINDKLIYSTSTGRFSCGIDNAGSAGLLATATIQSATITNATITDLSFLNATGSNLNLNNNLNVLGTSTLATIITNLVQGVIGIFTNLFATNANFANTNTGNLNATGTTNLSTTNISGPLSATSSTLNGTTTITGPLVLSPEANASLAAINASNTTNIISTTTNTFASIVNGVSSIFANIINSFAQSVTGNTLTSIVNGVTATTSIISSNGISTNGTLLTTTINGVATTTDLQNIIASSTSNVLTISTTTNNFTLTSIVNGKVATTSADFVNSNLLNSAANILTSSVNGITSTSSLINSNNISANAGVITTNINGVLATTSVSNLFNFLASSTNSNLTVSTTSAGEVKYTLSDNVIFSNATTTNFFTNILSALSANISDLLFGNATGTNLFVTNGAAANLSVSNLNTSNALTNTGNVLTSNVGGSIGTSTIISNNSVTFATSTGIITTNVNGVISTSSLASLIAATTTNTLSFSSTTNLITSIVDGITSTTTIDGLTNLSLLGTTTAAGIVANNISTNILNASTTNTDNLNFVNATGTNLNVIGTSTLASIITNLIQGVTGIFTNLFANTGNFGTINTGNLNATGTVNLTGTTNLSTTNISGPLTATSSTLNGTTTITGPLVLSPEANASLAAINASNTTNILATTTNTFASIVNGVTSAITNFINSFSQSSTGNILTSIINGVTATSSIINSNSISASGTILTSSINGVSTSTDLQAIINSGTTNVLTVATSTNSFTLTSNVNGVVSSTTANFVNQNDLTSAVNTLTSIVNGNTATSSIINSNTISANAGIITTNVNGVIATTSISNLYNYFASSTNQNLTVATDTLGNVTYLFTDNPIFGNATITNANITNLAGTNSNFVNSTSTNLFSNLINAVTGIFTNLFADNANFANTNTGNLNATGTTNLATTNISGPLTATSSTLNGTTTITGPLVLSPEANASLAAINASNTINVLATTTNTLQTIVNGIQSTIVNIINSFTQSVTGNTLTSIVNGVVATSSIITNNNLTTNGGDLISNINGVIATTSLSGLVASNTTNVINYGTSTGANLITSNVNGVISASTITELNNLSLGGTTTITGVLLNNANTINNGTTTNTGTTTFSGPSVFTGNLDLSNASVTFPTGPIANATITNLVANNATITNLNTSNIFTSILNTLTSNVGGSIGTTSIVNSNIVSTTTNSFTSVINGVASSIINFINSFTQSSTGNILTTNINGLTATSSIINNNDVSFATSTGIITTNVNGVISTTSLASLIAATTTNNLSFSSTTNLITSIVDGIVSTTTINGLTNLNLLGTTTASNLIATNITASNTVTDNLVATNATTTNLFSNLINAVTGIFQNLFANTGNFGTTNTGNLNATGTTNLATTNISGPLTATSSTLNGTTTITGPLVLSPAANASLSAINASNTTNTLSFATNTNTITNITNGVVATTTISELNNIKLSGTTTSENISNSGNFITNTLSAVSGFMQSFLFDNATGTNLSSTNLTATNATITSLSVTNLNVPNTLNSSGNILSSNVAGSIGTSTIINSLAQSISGTILTTSVNGVSTSTDLQSVINSGTTNSLNISTSTNSFVLTSIINGAVATTTGNFINSNILTSNINTLTSSVNGVSTTTNIVNSNVASSSANLFEVLVNGISSGLTSIINSLTTTLSGNTLTTTVNGVSATSSVISNNAVTFSTSTGVITSNVNGIISTTSLASLIAATTTNNLSFSSTTNLITSIVDGITSTTTIDGLTNLSLLGTTTAAGIIANNINTNTLSASTTNTNNLNAINATTSNLIASNANITNATITNAVIGNLSSLLASSTTNTISTTANTFQTIVNGVSSAITNLINSFTQSLTGNTLTTTINGVVATSSVISGNTLSLSGSTLTSNVNGVSTAASLAGLLCNNILLGQFTFCNGGNTSGANAVLGTNDNFAQVFETNNVERMRITNTGSVGVGITNPSVKFEVTDSVTQPIAVVSNGGNNTLTPLIGVRATGIRNGYLGMDATSSTLFLLNYGSGSLEMGNNGIFKSSLAMTNTGAVGIGTTAPNNKLEITKGVTGESGLRFTNLIATSATTTANGKVLTVNAAGDVILVDDKNGITTNSLSLTGNNLTSVVNGIATTTSLAGLVTADNGLTITPANNVRLGGTLAQDTLIDGAGANRMEFVGNTLASFLGNNVNIGSVNNFVNQNPNQIAIGYSNTLGESDQIAIGNTNDLGTGLKSYVIGEANNLSQQSAASTYNFVMGRNNENKNGDYVDQYIIGRNNANQSGVGGIDNYVFGYNNINQANGTNITIGGDNQYKGSGIKSGIFGYNNFIDSPDSFTFGNNLSNTIAGNIDIGTTDGTKISIDTNGRLTLRGPLSPSGNDGNVGEVLISQGAGVVPTWTNVSALLPATTNTLTGASTTNAITLNNTTNGVSAITTFNLINSNTLATTTNTFRTIVNGLTSSIANIISSLTTTLSGNTLTTTVNGVVATSSIISSNGLTVSGNVITSNVNGIISTTSLPTIATTTNIFTFSGSIATSTVNGIVATTSFNNLSIASGSVGNLNSNNLFSQNATLTNATITNLNATNISPSTLALIATNTTNTLTNATTTNSLTLTSTVNGKVATTTTNFINTNVATSSANLLTTIVNGITSTVANIINSFTQSATGNVLTTIINGVSATTSIITANTLSASGTVLTSNVNGVLATTSLASVLASSTTNTLTSAVNTLTNTTNGVIATSTIVNSNTFSTTTNTFASIVNGVSTLFTNIINSLTTTLSGNTLTTTVNGVVATSSVIGSNTLNFSTSTGLFTSTINGIAATSSLSGLVTANNGLTVNSGNNVQLGGTLIQNTNILGGTNNLTIAGGAGTTTINDTTPGIGSVFAVKAASVLKNSLRIGLGGDTQTNGAAGIAWNNFGAQDTSAAILSIQNASNSTKVLVDSNGNVGIGTTVPTTKLFVSDVADTRITVNSTGIATNTFTGFELRNSGTFRGGLFVENSSPDRVDLWSGFGGPRMSILGSNGNVGIGTLTPGNALTVASSTGGVSGLRLGMTSAAPSVLNTNKVLSVNAAGDVVMNVVPGTENIVEFSVNANPNIGGTTFSPSQPADSDVIYASTIDNSNWKWNGVSYVTYVSPTNNWALNGNTVPALRTLGTINNFDLPLITNNVERARIFSNGQFAINTITPPSGAQLTVAADINPLGDYDTNAQFVLSGKTNQNKKLALGYDTTNNLAYISSSIDGTAPTNLLLNPFGATVIVGTPGQINALNVPGSVGSVSALRLGINSSTATTTSNGKVLSVNAAGDVILVNDVTGSGATTNILNIATSTGIATSNVNGVISTSSLSGLVSANNGLTVNSGNNVQIGGTLLQNTIINNAGFNLNILGTGNVGIGTSTPSAALSIVRNSVPNTTVNGLLVESVGSSAQNVNAITTMGINQVFTDNFSTPFTAQVLKLQKTFGGAPYGFNIIHDGSNSSDSYLRFQGNDGGILTDRMVINRTNGNIGIGSTNPNNKLEITQGTAGNSGLRFTNLISSSATTTANGKVLSVNAAGDVVLVNDAGVGSVTSVGAPSGVSVSGAFISGSALSLTFADATNPGIVSTAAQSFGGDKTFVSGNMSVNSGAGTNTFTLRDAIFSKTVGTPVTLNTGLNTTGVGVANGFTVGNINTGIWSSAANFMNFSTNGVERMRVTDTGNVGIGTLTPGNALTVASSTGAISGLRLGVNAGTATTTANGKVLSVNASGDVILVDDAGVGAVTSLGVPSGSNANAGSIALGILKLSFADITNPGIVSTLSQSFAGNKTFTGANTIFNNTLVPTSDIISIEPNQITGAQFNAKITSADLTGNQTYTLPNASGIVCLTSTCISSIGAPVSPTLNGGSVTGGVLNLAFADAFNPGLLSNTAQTISGGKTFTSSTVFNNILTTITSGAANTSGLRFTNLTSGSSAVASGGKLLSVNSAGDVILVNDGSIGAVTSIGATIAPTPNGGTIAGNVLNLSVADNNNPGIVSTLSQIFGGNKTFTGATVFNNALTTVNSGTTGASGLRFTNMLSSSATSTAGGKVLSVNATGDIILVDDNLGPVTGATSVGVPIIPNINGGSITGNVLNLALADNNNPGIVSALSQIFGGNKTFTGSTVFSNALTSITSGTTGSSGLRFTNLLSTSATTTSNGKVLTVNASGDVVLVNDLGSNAITTLLAPTGTNANGGLITGNNFNLTFADGINPGILSSANWNTFNNKVTTVGATTNGGLTIAGTVQNPTIGLSGLTGNPACSAGQKISWNGSQLTCTVESGATSFGTPSGSNANGGSITSGVINLSFADATNPGIVSITAQTFAGAKTLSSLLTAQNGISLTGGGLFNNAGNTIGTDGNGAVASSLQWLTNSNGYAQTIYNQSAAGAANGLAIKGAGTAFVNKLLDISTGAQGVAGTPVFSVTGDGITTITPTVSSTSGLRLAKLTSAVTAGAGNGKVLTVDASGNVILAADASVQGVDVIASSATGTAVLSNTVQVARFQTVTQNINTAYNVATGVYTTPAAAADTYTIEAQLGFTMLGANQRIPCAAIRRAGVIISSNCNADYNDTGGGSAGGRNSVAVSATMVLTAGQIVDVIMYTDTNPTAGTVPALDATVGTSYFVVKRTGNAAVASDVNLKQNVQEFKLGLADLLGLNTVSYEYNGKAKGAQNDGIVHVGVLAQDIQATAFGQFAVATGTDGYLRFDKDPLIFASINAIKELNLKLETGFATVTLATSTSEAEIDTMISGVLTELPRAAKDYIKSQMLLGKKAIKDFTVERITALRGYFEEIFTKKIYTEELCVKKSDGSNVCVNGDQLQNVLGGTSGNTSGSTNNNGGNSGSTGGNASTTTDPNVNTNSTTTDPNANNNSTTTTPVSCELPLVLDAVTNACI